ncbi:MAG TPA: MBL fold metallo-hydrolase [Vicinamibacterales bacterium]|nr:MBL fold metallo-hydrolase [Vicinamibacterales bacterium]
MATLTFLGAARTVTGSKHLLEVDDLRVLIDCGLFQGLKDLRTRNWSPFAVRPDTIDCVVLTHAHIDHSGWLPRLVAQGFTGPVYCTEGTADLCSLVLPDAAHLQEEDARFANKRGYSRHHPALPLYTEADAAEALSLLRRSPFGRKIGIGKGFEIEFIHAGHLLGSSYVKVTRADNSSPGILFGGDLGRYSRPILPDPAPGVDADVLLVESTYGDRMHPPEDDGAALARIITDTHARRGKVIIPAFAIGRVEELLYWLFKLEDQGRLPQMPVYVDSPMAIKGIAFYETHRGELDKELDAMRRKLPRFTAVNSGLESKALVENDRPAVIIASSGMATGGRVVHHLFAGLPDPRNTVLFVGFQAAGTRGRQLIEGARHVKMFGQHVPVHAKIEKIDGLSSHADAGEIIRWLRTFPRAPRVTYLVHGEIVAQDALRLRIEKELGWRVEVPVHGQKVDVPL